MGWGGGFKPKKTLLLGGGYGYIPEQHHKMQTLEFKTQTKVVYFITVNYHCDKTPEKQLEKQGPFQKLVYDQRVNSDPFRELINLQALFMKKGPRYLNFL